MKKKVKAKAAKPVKRKAAKAAEPETEMPDLVAVMTKLTERLAAVESKVDRLLNQNNGQRPQHQQHHQPQHHHNRPQQPQHNYNQPAPQHQHSGKVTYPAVCAECRKQCELPFKPSQDRPGYCKECFMKRKSRFNQGNHGNTSHVPSMHQPPQKLVKVIRKGAGKITITDRHGKR